MFTVEQRLEMLRLVNKFDNVEITPFSYLLADFAIERGASAAYELRWILTMNIS